MNEQHGPEEAYHALQRVVDSVSYKPGWEVWLCNKRRTSEQYTGSEGLTLCISTNAPNSVRPGETTYLEHWFAPPPANWDEHTWQRWVLDQFINVETHEALEFYSVAGRKVFFPSHGPGRDPYVIERNPDPNAGT